MERYWNADNIEEYVLSACLHNEQALIKCMNTLYGARDFKNERNAQAFSVIENRFAADEKVDPLVVMDAWIDMGIYQQEGAQRIAGAWEGDHEYEPKIKELAKNGGIRKARKDITKLFDKTKEDVTPDKLAQQAFDLAISWNNGSQKKYYTANEVHEMKDQRGEKLELGIPLLDQEVYKHAGLHKGTVKTSLFRSKHGKTRTACFEVAQHLRQGRTVMYFTLEGQNNDILDNVKQILKDEWKEYGSQFLLVDDCFDIDSIKSAYIEAEFTEEGVDVCVVDYIQEVQLDIGKWVGDNERITETTRQLTQLATKYNTLFNFLSQSTTVSKSDRGYGHVPDVHQVYGSKQIIKASSLIMVGFRPKNYEDLLRESPMPPYDMRVISPNEELAPISSVFMKPVLSRRKLECQHRWVHMIDSDSGIQIYSQELI